MNPSYEKLLAAAKRKPLPIAVCAVLALAGLTYVGVSQYTKHAIQGAWKCNAGDGRLAGVFDFSDPTYLETHSQTEQYYGDYKVGWKTITTYIIGTTVGQINADENHPIEGEIDFIGKSKSGLLLKIWPNSYPMGVAVFCEPWNN